MLAFFSRGDVSAAVGFVCGDGVFFSRVDVTLLGLALFWLVCFLFRALVVLSFFFLFCLYGHVFRLGEERV